MPDASDDPLQNPLDRKSSRKAKSARAKGLVIDVIVEDDAWEAHPKIVDVTKAVVRHAINFLGIPTNNIEICISLTNNLTMQDLNRTYRDKDKPTNVLSFPMDDMSEPRPVGLPCVLGSLALGYEIITHEAAEQQKTFMDHFCHLIVHGVLHLLNYDHEEDSEAAEMEDLEIKILAGLGIANPYAKV